MGVIGGVLIAGLASSVVSSIFAPSPSKGQEFTPTPPTPSTPTVMPTIDSDAVKAAQQKSISEQVALRGRASTILSQGGTTDKLGG